MSSGFRPQNFEQLSRLEAKNFWFRVRNKIILWAINKYSPSPQSFLEVGCGTGFVTMMVCANFPNTKITGTEYYSEGLAFAKMRSPSADFIEMDARSIPFTNKFTAIGAFDVIEHIEEDEKVLTQIHGALQDKGFVYITVPQHKWLWSTVDAYTHHARRYQATGLHDLLSKTGFNVVRSTSFVTTLLPLLLINRYLNKNTNVKSYNPETELVINPAINVLLEWMMTVDLLLIRLGVTLPIGGSRLVVAQKC